MPAFTSVGSGCCMFLSLQRLPTFKVIMIINLQGKLSNCHLVDNFTFVVDYFLYLEENYDSYEDNSGYSEDNSAHSEDNFVSLEDNSVHSEDNFGDTEDNSVLLFTLLLHS